MCTLKFMFFNEILRSQCFTTTGTRIDSSQNESSTTKQYSLDLWSTYSGSCCSTTLQSWRTLETTMTDTSALGTSPAFLVSQYGFKYLHYVVNKCELLDHDASKVYSKANI